MQFDKYIDFLTNYFVTICICNMLVETIYDNNLTGAQGIGNNLAAAQGNGPI